MRFEVDVKTLKHEESLINVGFIDIEVQFKKSEAD